MDFNSGADLDLKKRCWKGGGVTTPMFVNYASLPPSRRLMVADRNMEESVMSKVYLWL